MRLRINLSWKVSLIVSLVIVLAMALVGWSVYQSTGNIVRDQVNDQLSLMSSYQWETIMDIFSSTERELLRIAQDSNVRSLADLANGVSEVEMEEFLKRNLLQSTGSRLDREVTSWDLLHVLSIATVDGVIVGDSRYKEASILDIMAGNSTITGTEHVGVKLDEAEYKTIPLGRTKEYDELNFVVHSVPITRQGTTDVIGYLIGVMDIVHLFAPLTAELGEYGNTVLMNEQGVVLNHSDQNLVGTTIDNLWYQEKIAEAGTMAEDMGDEDYFTLMALADGDLFLGSSVSVARMTEPIKSIAQSLVTMFTIALIAIFLVTSLFVRWQLRPLRVFVKAFEQMESGNLHSRSLFNKRMEKRRDEIGSLVQAFISMEGNLNSLVDTVSRSTQETAAATQQLSASSQETSASIQEVASKAGNLSHSAHVIDSSMGEFAHAVDHLNVSSQEMNKASTQVHTLAQDGLQLMETTQNSMANLLDSSADAKGSVVNLNKATHEIDTIVAVISDIAEQTNLLSLNASIEAARAGEHGRGFAVVANEIRQLADQTRSSTENIVRIIKELAMQTSETTAQINVGATNVQNTKETFTEIVDLIANLASNIQEVTESIALLSTNTNNILDEVKKQALDGEEILAATEEQAAMTAQNAALMENLANMANGLQLVISRFSA